MDTYEDIIENSINEKNSKQFTNMERIEGFESIR